MFGVPGICSGSQNGIGLVLPGGRVVELAAGVVVRVRDRSVLRPAGRRPEPRPVHPAAVGAHPRGVTGVLRRHVHVVVPEAALGAPAGGVPGGVLQLELGVVRGERAVLHDQRQGVVGARESTAVDQLLLGVVGDGVASGLTGVHVEPGDAPRVIVVEHQPRALLVAVVERRAAVVVGCADLRAAVRVGHVGDVLDADALRPVGLLPGGRDPLVRGAVADPRRDPAVQVQRRTVVLEAHRVLGGLTALRVADLVEDRALVGRVRHALHRAPCRSPSWSCRSAGTGRRRHRSAAGCGTRSAPGGPSWPR